MLALIADIADILNVRIQPVIDHRVWQNHWHSIMKACHHFVGLSCTNRAREDFRIVRSLPPLPQTRHRHGFTGCQRDVKRLLRLGVHLLPFVESACNYQAPAALERCSEHRFRRDRLRFRINAQRSAFRIFRPTWNQSPLRRKKFAFAIGRSNAQHLSRRCEIVPRRPIGNGIHAANDVDFCRFLARSTGRVRCYGRS